MTANKNDKLEIFEHKLSLILLNLYERLGDIAYHKYELVAADLIDFDEARKRKVLARAEGIVTSFVEAYTVATEEFENLTLSKYRVPSLQQKIKLEESIQKLGKQFEKHLKVIRAKAEVALEDIEDFGFAFDKIETLKKIEKLTFKQIIDSWISGKYLFP